MPPSNFLTSLRKAFLTPTKARKSYSQCAEDLIAENYFKGKGIKKGFYVDVGSHHPRRGSNTYRFYKKGWRGILVDLEDVKVNAAKLARPGDTVVKAAVSDKIEPVQIFSQGNFSTNTTISQLVAQKGEGFNPIGEIETTTLTNILQEHGCNSRFEFLNIDIEGNDLKALRGLNFSKFRPQLICVECWESELGMDELIKNEIYKYLSSNGYSLIGLSAPSAFFALSGL
jgi:FkbM family methyltransferase